MRILTRGCCLGQQHPRHNNNSSDVPLYRFEYFPSTALSRQSTNFQCISQVQEPPSQCLEITHQSSRNMTQWGRGYRQLEMSHLPWQDAHAKHCEHNYSKCTHQSAVLHRLLRTNSSDLDLYHSLPTTLAGTLTPCTDPCIYGQAVICPRGQKTRTT